jgi:hypothetical protein
MSYEALSTYIRAETSVFLQVCCAEERGVLNRECVGELIVNIGGLRRHLLPTAPSPRWEKNPTPKGGANCSLAAARLIFYATSCLPRQIYCKNMKT